MSNAHGRSPFAATGFMICLGQRGTVSLGHRPTAAVRSVLRFLLLDYLPQQLVGGLEGSVGGDRLPGYAVDKSRQHGRVSREAREGGGEGCREGGTATGRSQ